MVVYLARHVVYLDRVVVIGMGNIGMSNIGMSSIGMSNIGMSNIGMSNIGMSTGAYGNVKSPDFPLHHAPPSLVLSPRWVVAGFSPIFEVA